MTATNGSKVDVATIFSPVDMNNNLYPDVKLREVSPAPERGVRYRAQYSAAPAATHSIKIPIPTVKTAPLNDWKANNYAKVTEETQKMMDACVLELENQLPRLLKK